MATTKQLIPLWDNVIVEPKASEIETSSWIVLPDSKEKPMEWTVIAVNENSEKVKKAWIKKWDKVLYKKYSPTEIKIEWKEYFILESDDLLAKLW